MSEPFKYFTFPIHQDEKGVLTVAELADYLNWTPQRVYWITRSAAKRGVHAHRQERELFICIKGNISAHLHDGTGWHEKILHGPGDAAYVPAMVWHEFDDFSNDAVLLALSDIPYDKGEGYITDFDEFMSHYSPSL